MKKSYLIIILILIVLLQTIYITHLNRRIDNVQAIDISTKQEVIKAEQKTIKSIENMAYLISENNYNSRNLSCLVIENEDGKTKYSGTWKNVVIGNDKECNIYVKAFVDAYNSKRNELINKKGIPQP